VIHLDSNFLIDGVESGTVAAGEIAAWLLSGESLACSSIVWAEFLNGPILPGHVNAAHAFLTGGITVFDEAQAAISAQFFNACGRKRRHKFDCLIAAAAVTSGARLATRNPADFEPFISLGLQRAH
jgi:predicted nucleic acid-binding protein